MNFVEKNCSKVKSWGVNYIFYEVIAKQTNAITI